MSMFDRFPNFEDHFNRGDKFTLVGAKLGAMLNTVHGQSQQVLFDIDKGDGETVTYSAFGAGFVGQATRAERGDFPVEVEYIETPPKQQGHSPTKLLWPVDLDQP